MPKRAKPRLEARATLKGDWAELAAFPDVESALRAGDLVAADMDSTGTWPRWAEVRVQHSGKVIEHWLCRDRALRPTTEAGYVMKLMAQASATVTGQPFVSTLAENTVRRVRNRKPAPLATMAAPDTADGLSPDHQSPEER
jgi:hypothetical protein